ncbi:MAG: hypothetical protein AAGI34_08920 [Pseudomonadota bacterium]
MTFAPIRTLTATALFALAVPFAAEAGTAAHVDAKAAALLQSMLGMDAVEAHLALAEAGAESAAPVEEAETDAREGAPEIVVRWNDCACPAPMQRQSALLDDFAGIESRLEAARRQIDDRAYFPAFWRQ